MVSVFFFFFNYWQNYLAFTVIYTAAKHLFWLLIFDPLILGSKVVCVVCRYFWKRLVSIYKLIKGIITYIFKLLFLYLLQPFLVLLPFLLAHIVNIFFINENKMWIRVKIKKKHLRCKTYIQSFMIEQSYYKNTFIMKRVKFVLINN